MSTISMRTLTKAHTALVMAKAALEALPREQFPNEVWHAVMAAQQDLAIDLACMQPIQVTGAPE